MNRGGKSFLHSSLRMDGVTTILRCTEKPINTVALQVETGIKFKQSFQKYLRYCLEHKFIIRTEHSQKFTSGRFGKATRNGYFAVYTISKRGAYLLGLLQ